MASFSYDVLGNIAIIKFSEKIPKKGKINYAKSLMQNNPRIKTIVEKAGKVRGRLRTIKTNYLTGEKTLIADYIENGCRFRFNIETCYFSPRLSNERKEIADRVKKNEKVLVMFAGVAPFSVVIAKKSKAKEVYSIELGRECSKYAEENVKLNKISNVHIIQGDVKRIIPMLAKKRIKFDRIVMPRPQLKDTFLKYTFMAAKKHTEINYYGFGDDAEEIISSIKDDAKRYKKKIKILNVKKAGDIAPYKYRWRADMQVMN